MIPDESDAGGTRRHPSPRAAASSGSPGPPADEGGGAVREIDELTFLVGTSCSRTITLLMQPEAEPGALREELEFLAEKAARLAALLG